MSRHEAVVQVWHVGALVAGNHVREAPPQQPDAGVEAHLQLGLCQARVVQGDSACRHPQAFHVVGDGESRRRGLNLLAVVQDHVIEVPRPRVQEGVDDVRMEILPDDQNVVELVEKLLTNFFLDGQNVLQSEALQA